MSKMFPIIGYGGGPGGNLYDIDDDDVDDEDEEREVEYLWIGSEFSSVSLGDFLHIFLMNEI